MRKREGRVKILAKYALYDLPLEIRPEGILCTMEKKLLRMGEYKCRSLKYHCVHFS